MNDTLSLTRLSLLIKNHVVENRQRYLLYAFGMLAIGFIVYIMIFSVETFRADYYYIRKGVVDNPNDTTEWEGIQFAVYFAGLFVFGGIFACISFVNFSNSAEAIFYLNKPASHLEKWLTEIVVRLFFLFIAYTVIFYVLDIPATFLVRGMEYMSYLNKEDYSAFDPDVVKVFHASKIFHFYLPEINGEGSIIYSLLASIYISIVGFFMFGSVLFNRFSFFKTLFLAFIVGMVYFFYGLIFVNSDVLMPGEWNYHFPDRANWYDYSKTLEPDTPSGFSTSLENSFVYKVSYFLIIIVPIIMLFCSYFKLKEKEV